ncbi:molybdenum cofactor biosynthesis protein MoaE [Asticcacaulis sp. AND118]|uniref:molybdenum cofactor biosynthesis protein MoaE n=1 Tax=Asticcacaulis sp. AND118 TaxID=2840468 RepID=UPI001D000C57|nr:molybdenum cofactor biosynthesis protein MoaE [Asticcacaulis sp. AND118]UDF04286.1 molybdenum cofactor biosynthesis protein MoaE [Asticcacaulis sp. AND118]
MTSVETLLLPEALNGESLYGRFVAANRGAGALVTFSGRVRGETKEGAVSHLYLDWYPGMTEQSLNAIAADAAARFDVQAVLVAHRCGEVRSEEEIVFVATASAHRRAAFEAADYLMDRLKSEAALWKREVGAGFERWIEPTAKDANDLKRWEK